MTATRLKCRWGKELTGMALTGFVYIFPLLVSARESLIQEASIRMMNKEVESDKYMKIFSFLWRQGRLGDDKVWPDMEFGWRLLLGTLIGFFGASVGSVGGIGGGGIFLPMLILIIGFDPKSATAISQGMIMCVAAATVSYTLRLKHPTLDTPLIDYDLALLLQPMLVLGVSAGVTFNGILAYWMIILLLIIIFLTTSTKAFFKAMENYERETITIKELARHEESVAAGHEELEYESLPGGPDNGSTIEMDYSTQQEVSVLENIQWKELGLLVAVWILVLALQIAKSFAAACSAAYWVLNLLQVPVTVGAASYEAVYLYKGWRMSASIGQIIWQVHQLVLCCATCLLAGVLSGLLGIGGGFIIGPLFIEMGIHPQVSNATAAFTMIFSSSMSVIEYYLLQQFPVPYALYFAVVATIAAFAGHHVVRRLISLLGRASLLIFILSFAFFLGAIALGIWGIVDAVEMIENDQYMGLENICS